MCQSIPVGKGAWVLVWIKSEKDRPITVSWWSAVMGSNNKFQTALWTKNQETLDVATGGLLTDVTCRHTRTPTHITVNKTNTLMRSYKDAVGKVQWRELTWKQTRRNKVGTERIEIKNIWLLGPFTTTGIFFFFLSFPLKHQISHIGVKSSQADRNLDISEKQVEANSLTLRLKWPFEKRLCKLHLRGNGCAEDYNISLLNSEIHRNRSAIKWMCKE